MKKLIQISLMAFTLLATSGILATPIVNVKNNTKGKVKFGVDAVGGGKNDMWVDPKADKSYDSKGLILETIKVRYYPADGGDMASFDYNVDDRFNAAGATWSVSVSEAGVSFYSSGIDLGGDPISAHKLHLWTMNLKNQSPYIAIASWYDGFKVIEPGAEDTIKAGSIKLFEKENNPVALTKDDLNKKTLEINGSETEGFSLKGSGNATGSDSSRTYKNNTNNWVTYDYRKNANEWHLLKGANAQGNSEADKHASVRIYTKEKKYYIMRPASAAASNVAASNVAAPYVAVANQDTSATTASSQPAAFIQPDQQKAFAVLAATSAKTVVVESLN